MFKIGDRVKKKPCFYNTNINPSIVKIINKGTILSIKIRYPYSPNAHPVYIVQFDGKSLTNELEHEYTASSLEYV